MDGPEAPGPSPDAACKEGARGTPTEGQPAPEEARVPSAPDAGPPPAFTSSFSFIRSSLCSAPGEPGEAEGCPPARRAEGAGARAASPEGPPQDPGRLPPPDRPGGEGAAGRWDPLLRECEPLLQGCLLGLRRRLEVSAVRRELQKLQEKAMEEEDYDKGEFGLWIGCSLFSRMFRVSLPSRLDWLPAPQLNWEEEEEELSLPFQLPSRQPALRSLLVHLGAQAEAALHRAAQQPGGQDPHNPLCEEPPAEDLPDVSVARRDRLLQEKQQLQEEMAALQARMSMLAARDRQLSRELALQQQQQQRLRWPDCDLRPLLDGLTPGELQEVRQAARDALAPAGQTPLPAGPPETTRSLQGKLEALSRSLKELSAKVCGSQRLCGSLRRSLREIEAPLPALLEAKALAVA
ncbi:disrupted in schizophrenia 1 protein, partial [Pipistrellus kuhlii]|uniref:disrupted in schizophrenia 1 protein n=1 Tax=Pipistrellus kuhlii TaxID=59472 RepID=UPI001E270A3D